MELITPNVKGTPYAADKVVRIVDPNQYGLYLKHGLRPYDVYYGYNAVVMVFDREESYPLYKKYMERTLEW